MNTLVASKVLDHTGKPFKREDPARVALHNRLKAKYDSAQTTSENQTHWTYADGLSAAAANAPEIRKVLRDRARYEIANNPYASGMVRTMANEVVGTGPKLQMNSGDPNADSIIESLFWDWSVACKLANKLRMLELMVWQDGEGFALLTTNMGLRHPIKLDLKTYEADQVARPWTALTDHMMTDGIILDDFGNPLAYTVLRHHPGDYWYDANMEYDTIPAANMIHRFLMERPGQVRGVPGLMSSLPLFAQLRRYTLAVIAAAETAADLAVLLQTQGSAVVPDELEPLDLIDLERRTAMTLPQGWSANQMKAEQPTTTYPMFKREIVTEMARPMNMPSNVATGDSSEYNYASMRGDQQTFHKFVGVRRFDTDVEALNKILPKWWEEAWLAKLLPPGFKRNQVPNHEWRWDGREHVDPLKEANADVTLVNALLLSESEYHGKKGKDWEDVNDQIAKELGITVQKLKQLKLAARLGKNLELIEDDDDE